MIYFNRLKRILQEKIKKNIKNTIYDYEFLKKAVIIYSKLALLCVRAWKASTHYKNKERHGYII